MEKFGRLIFISVLAMSLAIGCAEKSKQLGQDASVEYQTPKQTPPLKFQVVAASCAAILMASHSQAVIEYIEKPANTPPAEEFALPVGAGGTRESIEKLLARAADKKLGKKPYNQKFVLPTPISHYEYILKMDFEKLTKEDIEAYVSFVRKDEMHLNGYFRAPTGEFGQFVSSRVDEDRYFYEIYSIDGSRRLGQGYWLD